jgi:hypothetical protein
LIFGIYKVMLELDQLFVGDLLLRSGWDFYVCHDEKAVGVRMISQ